MNGDDERDYAEEAAVQRDAEREGAAELAAEQAAMELAAEQQDEHARDIAGHAQLVDGPTTGPGHYREAQRLLATGAAQVAEAVAALKEEEASTDPLLVLLTAVAMAIDANTHAVLAQAAATALKDPEQAGFYTVDRRDWEAAASLYRERDE